MKITLCKNAYRLLCDFLDDRKEDDNISVSRHDVGDRKGLLVNGIGINWVPDKELAVQVGLSKALLGQDKKAVQDIFDDARNKTQEQSPKISEVARR